MEYITIWIINKRIYFPNMSALLDIQYNNLLLKSNKHAQLSSYSTSFWVMSGDKVYIRTLSLGILLLYVTRKNNVCPTVLNILSWKELVSIFEASRMKHKIKIQLVRKTQCSCLWYCSRIRVFADDSSI